MNTALTKIYKSKRFQTRYNDYMERDFGDKKCDSPIMANDDVLE